MDPDHTGTFEKDGYLCIPLDILERCDVFDNTTLVNTFAYAGQSMKAAIKAMVWNRVRRDMEERRRAKYDNQPPKKD